MITKFLFKDKSTPEERTFIKDNDMILEDFVCDAIKAAVRPFYQLNDIYVQRLSAIESKMCDFDQAMGLELRKLQAEVISRPYSQISIHKRLDNLQALIMQIPGLKEAIEEQEARTKAEAEAKEFMAREDALDLLIEDLELSVRSHNCLKNAHGAQFLSGDDRGLYELKTVRDLIKYTPAELLRMQNFGRKSLNEIKELLATMGFKWA